MKDVKDTDYSKWTREDFVFHHRKMWNWIADQTLKLKRKVTKEEYFEAMGIPVWNRPLHRCYCCQYVFRYFENTCESCPIDWTNGEDNDEFDKYFICTFEYETIGLTSIFIKWLRADYYKEAARLARTIANLPEKENV